MRTPVPDETLEEPERSAPSVRPVCQARILDKWTDDEDEDWEAAFEDPEPPGIAGLAEWRRRDDMRVVGEGVATNDAVGSLLRVVPDAWRSIYPQRDGEPYATGGKHKLRLWLGGAWRRLVVDDRLPLDADGRVLVTTSSDASELWPSLVAKALLKLWAMLEGGKGCGSFAAFAMHVLKGWVPSRAASVGDETPRLDLESAALASTARVAPGSPVRRRGRRHRASRDPTPETLAAAAAARNAAAADMRKFLFEPRDEFVVVLRAGIASRVLAVIDDEALLAWDCPDISASDFGDAPLVPMHDLVRLADLDDVLRVSTRKVQKAATLDVSWRSSNESPEPLKPTLLNVDDPAATIVVSVVADAPESASAEKRPVVLCLRPPQGDAVSLRVLPEAGCFATGTVTACGSSVYRVELDAPLGARVEFESRAALRVGPLNAKVETGSFGREGVAFRRLLKGDATVSLELWVADAALRPYASLHTFDLDSGEEILHPLLEIGSLKVTGRLVVTGMLAKSVAPTDWRLYVGGNVQVETLGDPKPTRFAGRYKPNAHLRLFRDVLRPPPGPLQLRLDVSCPARLRVCRYQPPPSPEEGDLDNMKGSEGPELLSRAGLASICLPCVWPDAGEESVVLVVEASLDSDVMDVPAHLRSTRPFAASSGEGDGPLSWELEITASGDVELEPDSADDAAWLALRQAWETADPGRADRAKTLRDCYINATDDKRAQALAGIVAPDVEAARQKLRRALPNAIVRVEDSAQLARKTDAAIADEAAALDARLEAFRDAAPNFHDAIAAHTACENQRQVDHLAALRAWRHQATETALAAINNREAYRCSLLVEEG